MGKGEEGKFGPGQPHDQNLTMGNLENQFESVKNMVLSTIVLQKSSFQPNCWALSLPTLGQRS